ncbi:MAG: cysteine synthase family protein [Thermodesulfobacteriota bacterium]|nr:cysteine synthase family protein [Thermodesulfobacteriota bacterium]
MSIVDLIGNTPLVEIRKLNPNPKVRIMGKLEGTNPGGSVKDRVAYYMIKTAEEDGCLTPDKIVLEPTSGNTGIGLAMVGAAKGYRVKLTMPECVSQERRNILIALGAELELTPDNQGTDGAIRRAHEIIRENKDAYFMPNQFDNPGNILAHYETTAHEIIRQTDGDVDIFVAGMGTTGTLMGVSKRLKEFNNKIKIVGVEPTIAHTIQGLKNMKESIVPGIFDPSRIDERVIVEDEPAYSICRKLALEEGIFVGMSSGAAMFEAINQAKKIDSGTIVVIFPDRGDRYLSTTLFRPICAKCPP